MGRNFLRTIIGTIVGILLAFGLLYVLQLAGSNLAPDVYDPGTDEILVPIGSTIALLLGWFIGSFAGAWLAMRVSGAAGPGWIVGGAMIGAALYRAWTISDAWWIVLAGLLIPLTATLLAQRAAALVRTTSA